MTRVRVIDTQDVYGRAIRQRKVFHGSVAKNRIDLSSSWPKELVHIGKCVAEIYWSNKALGGGKWEVYKHIAEAGQDLFINPENTTLIDRNGLEVRFVCKAGKLAMPWREKELLAAANPGAKLVFGCQRYEIHTSMPKFISVLAEDRGVQAVLHDGSYYEIRLAKATWGSGIHPETGETFLVLYTKEGVHFLVTGVELDITEDGIVG